VCGDAESQHVVKVGSATAITLFDTM